MKRFRVINIAPLYTEHKTEAVADLRQLEAECGVTDVAFMLPLNPEGREPSLAKAEYLRGRFLEMREGLRASGSTLKVGILLQSLLGHGTYTESPFQRIVKPDGSTNHRMCPLDEDFRDHIGQVVAMMAKTRPAFLLVDDDFRLFSGGYGCFCPLHLAAFNQKMGANYDRGSLMAVLQKEDDASCRIGEAWTALLLESLETLARIIRARIDDADPNLSCGLCASMDGAGSAVFNAPITGTLAGRNPPLVRLNNSWYLGNDARGLMSRLYPTAVQMAELKDVPEILSESDTFPHNRYSTPARALHAHLVFSLLHGTTGAKLWVSRTYGYEPASGLSYRETLRANRGLYQTLFDLVPDVTWDEPSTPLPRKPVSPWNPAQYGKDHMATWTTHVCGLMGIPCRVGGTSESAVVMLTGPEVAFFTHEELTAFLTKGVLLDGGAAEQLCRRGFAELLGVEMERLAEGAVDVERLTHHQLNGSLAGQQITWATFYGTTSRRIIIRNDNVQSLSSLFRLPWYLSPEPVAVGSGVTLFENRLGGRIAIIAATLDYPNSFLSYHTMFMNESRRHQLVAILDWLNRAMLPAIVLSDVDLYVRHGVIAPAAGGGDLLAIFNMNMDPLPALRLRLGDRQVSKLAKLNGDGAWIELEWHADSGTELTVNIPIEPMVPLLLRIN